MSQILQDSPATRADIDRIESQIEKLTEAVHRLIVVEERQSTMGQRLNALEREVAAVSKHATNLESSLARWINRGIGAWAVAALVFAIVNASWGMRFLAMIVAAQ